MRPLIRKRGVRVLGLGALVLALAGGVAYATIPANSVYTACMLKATGTVRLIDASLPATSLLSHCTSLETPVSWNQKGQDGPQGVQGPKGEPGAPGKDGVNGSNGVDGKDGTAGKDGAPGKDGATGPQGPRGLQGPPGVAGPAISDLAALNGIPCTGDTEDWPGTVVVTVGAGVGPNGPGGAVTLKCMPLAAKTLTLTWTGNGSYSVRFVGASSVFRQCFIGLQPGPTYSCSVNVPPAARIEIGAFPGTLTGTLTAWGGACAGIGTGIGLPFPARPECVLTMDADQSVSATFDA